ncbi:DUF6338 family protein [Pseudomonas fuscovaginae UPB0736]|uniref:DUF6338 family protein n=1 Tax=Pseudomonas asplenii TaxID=53407 RepID=UPI000288F44C|nr:DUF6338 family protein [Pseudomonas fuscovaginae]UUQ65179.1 DUF6338 family protein [Pseudomonas fuscovaginae UPB0736]
MDDLVKEVIPLLQYLIPGFLTAWIFYSLTAFKRPDTFGQIVQALIFTFVVHGIVLAISGLCLWIGSKGIVLGRWDEKAEALWSFVISVLIGLISCYLATSDKLHTWLRNRGITEQTSYPNEWYSTFSRYPRFVVLHLNDERRLYGWPSEWPNESTQGQFAIQNPAWLDDKGVQTPCGAQFLVIDASKVQWVEFDQAMEDEK